MRAAGPAAGSSFPFEHIGADALDVFLASLGFLHRRRPANPLVARQWCQVIPGIRYLRRRQKRRAHIGRYRVDHS